MLRVVIGSKCHRAPSYAHVGCPNDALQERSCRTPELQGMAGSQWCALPHRAHPCQVQQGTRARHVQREKKETFLRMSDNHNLFSSFLPGLWQNHSKFYSVLLYEYKNLKLIPLRKAATSFTLKSMISSDDFRFIVPQVREKFDP